MAENRASRHTREPEYAEGAPCWADAQLPDVAAGRRFYGELFGWTFEERPAGGVRALKDCEPVASLGRKTDGRLPTVWTVSFATPDAEAICRRIRAPAGPAASAPLPGCARPAPGAPGPRTRAAGVQPGTAPLPGGGPGPPARLRAPERGGCARRRRAGPPGRGRRAERGTSAWVQR